MKRAGRRRDRANATTIMNVAGAIWMKEALIEGGGIEARLKTTTDWETINGDIEESGLSLTKEARCQKVT